MTNLYMKVVTLLNFDTSAGTINWQLTYSAPDGVYAGPSVQHYVAQGTPQNPSASPWPIFPTEAAAIAYYAPSAGAYLIADANTIYGTTVYTGYTVESVDSAVDARFDALALVANTGIYSDLTGRPSIPAAQIQSDWSQASTGALDYIKNKPTINTTRTTSSFTPTLVGTGATGTQLSSTKDGKVTGTFSTQFTYSLAGNPASNVTMKICATNNATEGSWTTVGQTGFDQQSGLAVTIGQSIRQIGQICSDVPAGWYFKFVNTGAGTHSEAVISGQQTVLG